MQDPTPAPPAQAPRADRRFLQRIAMDILYRSLSPREVGAYMDADAADVVKRLYGNREAMEIWLEEELLYFMLLDQFRPQNEAIKDLPRRLHNGDIDVRHGIAEIMLSTGFSLRNPGNDTFVTVVLEQGMGIKVQSRKGQKHLIAGKKMYDGQKLKLLGVQGQSQADIIKIVVGQRGFTHLMLNRHHERILGDSLPLDHPDVDRMHGDPSSFFDILSEWILSETYRAGVAVRRRKTDNQFVRGLYMDLLGRLPKGDELRNMRNAMLSMADPAPLRAVMAKVILDSGKPRLPQLNRGEEQDFVLECFRNYLSREPSDTEAAAYVNAIQQDGATARQIVRALVGSPEYQLY